MDKVFLIFLVGLLVITQKAESQPLAFPEAKGCGCFSSGGRGGKVIFVSNLNDSGKGSLRDALTQYDYPRTILFSVSGTIFLKSKIEVTKGNFTMAGQSAPGEGICVAGAELDIEADNVIIRYVRFRPGDINNIETDALTIKRSKNVIVDHCSMSWSSDETCSCYDNQNFTLQWCILSESLNNSVHHKGKHGYGGIWGGMNASFHHNLLADHNSRNPRLNGSRYHKQPDKEKTELINNVIYNWGMKCIYAGEEGEYTITGNYLKPGKASLKPSCILEPWKPYSYYYFADNYVEGNPLATANNRLAIDKKHPLPGSYIKESPLQISNLIAEPAAEAYNKVLENAGASLWRDTIDRRIIEEVRNGKYTFGKKGIIDSQKDAGGWPELKGGTPLPDSDRDGMPDSWETKNQLNPNNASDGSIIDSQTGYSNLEKYLNELCNK